MANKHIVGLFSNYDDADKAVARLASELDYGTEDITVIGREETFSEYMTDEDVDTKEDVSDGAATGAALGGITGLLVGIGAITIPGIGPVVAGGALATALASTAVGAAGGGIIGALVDVGIPDKDAEYYAEGVKRGGILVAVPTDNNEDAVREIMTETNAYDIDKLRKEFEDDWEGFDYETEPDKSYPSL